MKDKINIGDKVNIYFEYCQCLIEVEVLHIPCATGDSWTVKDSLGNISKVNNFCRMDKLSIKQEVKTEEELVWDN